MINTYSSLSGGAPAHITSGSTMLVGISRQDAFACLYDAYVDRIRRIVLFRVVEDKLAEEITADVFLEAWEQLPAYRTGKTPIIAWLYGITQQAVIEYYRTRESSILVTQANPAEIGAEPGVGKQLQLQVMAVQPDKDIQVVGVGEPLPLQALTRQPGDDLQESTDPEEQPLILGFIGELSASEIALKLDKQRDASLAAQISGLRGLVRFLAPQEDEIIPLDRELSVPVMA